MEHLRFVTKSKNLEIISKLMNSVAKQYGCKVTYCDATDSIHFHGRADYRRHITEETLSFFKAA